MITLPTDLASTLVKDVFYIRHLVSFAFTSETVRYTECDQNIYYNGTWYDSHPLEFSTINFGQTLEAMTIEIKLSNVDKKFSTLVEAEDIRDKVCQIRRVPLTNTLAIATADAVLIFYGYVDSVSIDKREARISVSDELIRWKTRIPRRMHDEHCTWKDFKGTECQYAGAATWCDKTGARCTALANYNNFGGFSHVVELENKEIWWGRTPSSYMNAYIWLKSRGH